MKLFIILNRVTNKIVAISEYKYHITAFYIQNNYTKDIFTIIKLTDKNKINSYLLMMDDYYLEEFNDFIIRAKDRSIIESIIYHNYQKLNETIDYLKYIRDEYNLSNQEIKNISKTISILKKNKKKDIKTFMDISSIIRDYYNLPSIQKELLQLENRYNYALNKEDY